MLIAVDGPAASGKGTLARRLAAHLGLPYLDTGLLYRAVARSMLDSGVPLDDAAAAARIASTLSLKAIDAGRLRGLAVGEAASVVSAYGPVRDALLSFQRRFAEQDGGAVLDGRDIGTVVCPQADVKIYLTASVEERAQRRFRELTASGEPATVDAVLDETRRRDLRDHSRSTAPLRPAADAHRLDTSGLDPDAVFAAALRLVGDRTRA